MSVISYTDLKNVLEAYHDTEITPIKNKVTTLEKNFHIKRYGIRIDQSNSDPEASVTYLYDAVGMRPAGLNSSNVFDYGDWQDFVYDTCKPVMLNPDGTVKYDLDRDDQTKKADGTASEISNSTQTANAMVQYKKLYVSVTEPGTDIIDIVFSNLKIDDTYHALGFEDGTSGKVVEKSYFYYAMFLSTLISNLYRSLDLTYVNNDKSCAQQREIIQNIGTGWDFHSAAQFFFILYLHMLIGKTRALTPHFGDGSTVRPFWIKDFYSNAFQSWLVGLLASHGNNGNNGAPSASFYAKASPPYTVSNYNSEERTDITPPIAYITVKYLSRLQVWNECFLLPKTVGGSSSAGWCMGFHNDNQNYNPGGIPPTGCVAGIIHPNCYTPYFDWNCSNDVPVTNFLPRLAYL